MKIYIGIDSSNKKRINDDFSNSNNIHYAYGFRTLYTSNDECINENFNGVRWNDGVTIEMELNTKK